MLFFPDSNIALAALIGSAHLSDNVTMWAAADFLIMMFFLLFLLVEVKIVIDPNYRNELIYLHKLSRQSPPHQAQVNVRQA